MKWLKPLAPLRALVQRVKNLLKRRKIQRSQRPVDWSIWGRILLGLYGAEKVEVLSKKHGKKSASQWTSDGQSGYSITDAERAETGTSIILYLRKEAKNIWNKSASPIS